MTPNHKIELIKALKFYIKTVAPYAEERHITLLEEIVAELQDEVPPTPDAQDLFNDAF